MNMNVCIYCMEEEEYAPIIPKPKGFVYKGMRMNLIDEGKPVCLNCLNFEIDELKEC